MAGVVDTMAVTPQMLVPAANKVPKRSESPSRSLNQRTNTIPTAIAVATTGNAPRPQLQDIHHAQLGADEDDA